jgi:hypothetical protein
MDRELEALITELRLLLFLLHLPFCSSCQLAIAVRRMNELGTQIAPAFGEPRNRGALDPLGRGERHAEARPWSNDNPGSGSTV